MRRHLAVLLAALTFVAPGAALAAGGGGGGGGGGGRPTSPPPSCPPSSPNSGNPQDCGHHSCNDKQDNDGDGFADRKDPNDCQGGDTTENTPIRHECNDGLDNDNDGGTDAQDPNDCQGGDTTENTPGGGGGGGGTPCTAAGGDEGLSGDTLGQRAYDGGLKAAPVFEDPEGDGAVTGPVKGAGNGTQLEPLTNEAACAGDLVHQEGTLPVDP